jgi:glycosyltransferase involved in cell wall biosynthesis
MKIAMLHYHMRPGGVTTVIRSARRALENVCDVQVLADFDYNQKPAPSRGVFLREARALCDSLVRRLAGVDLLHTHNVGLGKHPRLTAAVKLLAETGRVKILNQVHDFPEDNRPRQLRALRTCTGVRDDRFWRGACYYDLAGVRWATLTSHDSGRLAARGVPAGKIDVLPNPVDDLFFSQAIPPATIRHLSVQLAAYAERHRYRFDPRRRLLLCPMKVMVRKNSAEAVELARRLGERYQLLITLDAASPRDQAYSASLKRHIRRERLAVVIGAGAELENPVPLFHLAHAVLTTAQQEGFGYAFLEGWLCGKLVVGRDIPAVTADLTASGMDLRHLYPEFDDAAVRRIARMLARRPRDLIERNRAVVIAKYSPVAYARRYATIVSRF